MTAPDPLAPFDYTLPDELIARFPPERRDGGRLLVVAEGLAHRAVGDLPELLAPGDLLVVNEVPVHRARLRARRASGGAVEVLLTRPVDERRWEALVRPGRRLREGESLPCGAGRIELVHRHPDGAWTVEPFPDVDRLTATAGEVPLPPYLGRAPVPEDDARYQTVYAVPRGYRAAAAPTAGLHFTPELLERLAARGVNRAALSLEVGAGTFRPLDATQLATGRLHAERYHLPESTWEQVRATRAAGGQVVAVGTTVVRVLESAVGPGPGETDRFLRPGDRFRVVDRLFTNLHLPRSSLLMLVAAFAGTARVRRAYEEAVRARYRFFSYGDAMLLSPRPDGEETG